MSVTTANNKYGEWLTSLMRVLLLLLLLWFSKDFGVTSDEALQQQYGEYVYAFFHSFGTDQRALHFSNLYLYGGMFDFFAVTLQKMLPEQEPYALRHVVNAAFAWVGFYYTSKCAEVFGGWRAALLALILLALSPMYLGHCFNNPKDIPFASFYIMGIYYLLCTWRDAPNLKVGHFAGLAISGGLAINARVGGILLIAYLGLSMGCLIAYELWQTRRITKNLVLRALCFCGLCPVVTLYLGVLFWPWALGAPLTKPLAALTDMANFSGASGTVVFDGYLAQSLHLPWQYVPQWFAVTTPLVILVGAGLALLMGWRGRQRWGLAVLCFAFVYPVVFIIIRKSFLYDGVRQVLFAYPPFVVTAALGLLTVWQLAGAKGGKHRQILQGALAALAIALSAHAGLFIWRYHPNEAVYFNQIVGGTGGAFRRYEMDYWGNCNIELISWMREKAQTQESPLKFTTEGPNWMLGMEHLRGPYLQLVNSDQHPDVHVMVARGDNTESFAERAKGGNVLYKVEVDGAPICIILKT